LVQEVTDEIKKIGDKLVESPELANDPAALEQIRETLTKAEIHYEAAGIRRAELGKENAQTQDTAAIEYVAPLGESSERGQASSARALSGSIKNAEAVIQRPSPSQDSGTVILPAGQEPSTTLAPSLFPASVQQETNTAPAPATWNEIPKTDRQGITDKLLFMVKYPRKVTSVRYNFLIKQGFPSNHIN
jgi:hypothetical protein